MKSRTKFVAAAAVTAALVGTAGSGVAAQRPQQDTVDLTILSNSIKGGKSEAEATWIEDTLIPAFEAEMEAAGTPVNVEFLGRGVDDEDYKSQLALDLQSGTGPDVFSIDGIWVGEFATANYIAPLADTAGAAADEWDGWDQIDEAVQANGIFEDQRYGIPQGTDGRVIYYNKDIFEAAGLPADWAPATVDEVLEAARTIKESNPDVIPLQINGGVAMGEATTMQGALPLLAAAGAPIWDPETSKWTGATPEMIQMLGTYATVYGDEGLGDVDMQTEADGRNKSFEEFAAGNIGMLLEGDYFWRSVINPDQGEFPMEGRDDKVGYALIPAYEAGGALGGLDAASMSGGGVWTINPNTKNAEMAWNLLSFMMSKEQVISAVGETPRITARNDVNAEILSQDPMLTFVADEALPVTHFRPGFAEYPEVSVALQEAVEAVVTGTSPEDAAADYQSALEGIVGAENVTSGDDAGATDGTAASASTAAGSDTTAAAETTEPGGAATTAAATETTEAA